MISISFIWILVIAGIINALLVIRSELVFRYRMKVLSVVFIDKNTRKRKLLLYQQVSHHEMVFKFWKPLDSFFDKRIFK